MTSSQLRELIHAVPFKPFTIRLADGEHIPVPHPDFIHMTGAGGVVFVTTEADDYSRIIDVSLITQLVVAPLLFKES